MKIYNKLVTKILAFILVSSLGVMTVSAAFLSSLSDTMSTLNITTLSNHDFSFITPTGIAAAAVLTLKFPTDFSIPAGGSGLSFSDIDLLDDGVNVTLANSPAGATWGVATTSSTITFTNGSSAVAANSVVRIKIGTNATNQSTGIQQITNATTPGNYGIGITGNFGDVGTTTVDLATNDNVSINAVVNQTITFSVSSNTINFGALGSGAVKYASSTNANGDTAETIAHTLTMATNGTGGYSITVRGATLTSQQNSVDTITPVGATSASSTPGTEQFAIRATSSGGTGATIDDTYKWATSYGYDGQSTTTSAFATGSVATNTTTFSLRYIANITATTESGNYATTLTYVGTANY